MVYDRMLPYQRVPMVPVVHCHHLIDSGDNWQVALLNGQVCVRVRSQNYHTMHLLPKWSAVSFPVPDRLCACWAGDAKRITAFLFGPHSAS